MDQSYQAFISYSHKDREWVRGFLVERLDQKLIKVCIDYRDFDIGIASLYNMERAVERSRKTILVITANWIQSEWAAFESLLIQSQDPSGVRQRILPLLLEDVELPRRLSILTWADFRDPAQREIELEKVVRAIMGETAEQQLSQRLEEALSLFLRTSYERDQFAKLDQSGEADPDRSTLLRRVFVDLTVSLREGLQPYSLLPEKEIDVPPVASRQTSWRGGRSFSAMRWLLQSKRSRTVLIGGPGQGKSTLGQYLAQVHRARLLRLIDGQGRTQEEVALDISLDRPRVPFRVILKYLAQWLRERSSADAIEIYLAEQVARDCVRSVTAEDIHDIFRFRQVLVIFDGLDEVMEPEIRYRMLSRIQEFVERMTQLNSLLQVVATSRPTGYNDYFNPGLFWHLELQLLTKAKVEEYASRWVEVKVSVEEERRRVMETLKECQAEDHTKHLLVTPLQVAIVLLIIKDGGRPPAQREALFNEFWGTIFRRERAKGRGVIRNEESILFDLHSYLGYLLHQKAAAKNVRSLLPEQEFRDAIEKFLRSRDSRSSDSALKERAAQLIHDARLRLVLLVEPEPGFFGFELRSFQEFFAAAYLCQSARNTDQRFARMKTISYSEHWRNVALFFAGRVVRTSVGEAGSLLELVCRSMDRDGSNRFRKRGAWLALDLAVDGVFSFNRDLHYGALEYALTVLEVVNPRERLRTLQSSLEKLPREDVRELVGPLLDKKIGSLGVPLLIPALRLIVAVVRSRAILMKGVETLLAYGASGDMRFALGMAFSGRLQAAWITEKLRVHWDLASSGEGLGDWLRTLWGEAPKLFAAVMREWQPSKALVRRLLSGMTSGASLYHSFPKVPLLGGGADVSSPADQMIIAFEALAATSLASGRGSRVTDRIRSLHVLDVAKWSSARRSHLVKLGISESFLRDLLGSGELIHEAKVAIARLLAVFEYPCGEILKAYSKEGQSQHLGGAGYGAETIIWPILDAMVRGKLALGPADEDLLSERGEVGLSTWFSRQLRESVESMKKFDWDRMVEDLRLGLGESYSHLRPSGHSLGVVQMCSLYITASEDSARRAGIRLSKLLSSGQAGYGDRYCKLLADSLWRSSSVTKRQFEEAVEMLQEVVKEKRSSDFYGAVCVFVVLCRYEIRIEATEDLLAWAGERSFPRLDLIEDLVRHAGWGDSPSLEMMLVKYVRSGKGLVKRGALLLWDAIASTSRFWYRRSRVTGAVVQERGYDGDLLSWDSMVRLMASRDRAVRSAALPFLIFCKIPIERADVRAILLRKMSESEEDHHWVRFFAGIRIVEGTEESWRELIEEILSRPVAYSREVVESAGRCLFDIGMNRDQTLEIS